MTTPCPSDDELSAFTFGALAGARLEGLEAHLDACATCRQVVAMVVQGSSPRPKTDALVLQPGTRLGRYQIERLIGAGGMGLLYVAHDPKLARRVAVKLLRAASDTENGRLRLLREARAMATLSHPNVVSVFDIGEADDRIFMAMELVEGGTLRDWMSQPHGWREIVAMFCAAGDGLVAAHAAGVIHRDFKPENVMVGRDGRPRVGDFGLARPERMQNRPVIDAAQPTLSRVTRTGVVMGTPAYMAPEQLRGLPADPRADQYAFCASLLEAIAGHDEVPAHIWAAVAVGLSPSPSARFASVSELLEVLRQEPRPVRAARRWSAVAALAAGLVMGLAWPWARDAAPAVAAPTVEAATREPTHEPAREPAPEEPGSTEPIERTAVAQQPEAPSTPEAWLQFSPLPSRGELTWPADVEVHVVSGYEVKDDSRGPRVAISLERPGADVVLVLTSHEAIEWTVTVGPQTRLREIVFAAGDGESEVIAGKSIKRRAARLPYASGLGDVRGLKLALRHLFGVHNLASLHMAYGLGPRVTVDSKGDEVWLKADGPSTPATAPEVHLELFDFSTRQHGSRSLGPQLIPTLRGLHSLGGTVAVSRTDLFEVSNDGVVRVEKLGEGARTLWRPSKKVPTLSWPLGIVWNQAGEEVVLASFGGDGYLYRINGHTGEWTRANSLNGVDLRSLAHDPYDAQLIGSTSGRSVLAMSLSGVPTRVYEALPDIDYLLGEDEHYPEPDLTLLPAKEGLVILGYHRERDGMAAIPELRGIWFAPRGSLRPVLIWRAPLINP